MDAFHRVAGSGKEIGDCAVLVSTLKPCGMCLSASMIASIDVVVYGLVAPADGGSERIHAPRSPESIFPRILGRVRAAETRQLLVDWLAQGPDPKPRLCVEQLLAETTPEGGPKAKTEIKIES